MRVSHIFVKRRVIVLLGFIFFTTAALGCRLIYLQGFQHAWLSDLAEKQRTHSIPVEALRGTIYDRNGEILAVSTSAGSVYAVPAEVEDAEKTAKILSKALECDFEKLLQKLRRRQSLVWIERRIDGEKEKNVRALSLPGIGVTQESERIYPQGMLAAHILGFTGLDNQGLDGIELAFDDVLRGQKGSIDIEYDAGGRELPRTRHTYVEPVKGRDLYLTIDTVMQRVLERELDDFMRENGAKGISAILLQPDTGEILALANRPAYDPNHFSASPPSLWRNKAVADAFEPGSTFKILTLAASLDSGVASRNESFFDNGFIEVQGSYIHCWKHGGHGRQSFDQMVWNSCNPGFVMLGLRVGTDTYYDYLGRFGFGKKTDVDLPGEGTGILYKKNRVQPLNLATMAMGQSIAVTPVQLTAAIASVINGGAYYKPQIVKEFGGEVKEIVEPKLLRQVIKPEVSKAVREILTGVVENGSGRNAAVDGYKVGGKTGTAQKVGPNGGYQQGKYIASFAGFVPAEKPEMLLYIAIDEPEGMYYGGQVAAPRFRSVMQTLLPYTELAKKNRHDDGRNRL